MQPHPPWLQAPSFPPMFIHWAASSQSPNHNPPGMLRHNLLSQGDLQGPLASAPSPAALPFHMTTTPSTGTLLGTYPLPACLKPHCCTQTSLPMQSCLPLHAILTAPHSLKLDQLLQSSFSPFSPLPRPRSSSKFPDSVPTITLPGQAPGPEVCPHIRWGPLSHTADAQQVCPA